MQISRIHKRICEEQTPEGKAAHGGCAEKREKTKCYPGITKSNTL